MTEKRQQHGFSLTETLMALGTLAIGMTFIAGTFLTGMYFSTFSTERTIAAVAAEEAFAKVRLFGLDPNHPDLRTDGFTAYEDLVPLRVEEQRYPSLDGEIDSQYSWAMICRRTAEDSDLVQCVVFVSRETGGNSYWRRASGASWPQLEPSDLPRPVRVNVFREMGTHGPAEIAIRDAVPGDIVDERTFIRDSSILVDDATGQVFRVLERVPGPPDRILLDREWIASDVTSPAGGWVWIIPPAASGGRNPGIAVYQKVLRFPRQ